MQDVITDDRPTPGDRTDQDRVTGEVRWFSATRGYGIISPDDDGPEVFVEHDTIAMDGFRTLRAGQRVAFRLSADAHGPVALDVRPD